MTKINPLNQIASEAPGDPRVYVQLGNGLLAFVHLDPETLVIDGDPPTLRALIPVIPPPTTETTHPVREVKTITYENLSQSWSLAYVPVPTEILFVFRNGLLMHEDSDYTVTNNLITFLPVQPITPGDILQFHYRRTD